MYKRFVVLASSLGELIRIYIRVSNSTYTNIQTYNSTQIPPHF